MEPISRNSYWDALLAGRRFEVRVPSDVETCIARLEKHAAASARFALRFSKVKDGLYDFELRFASIGVETVGRGKLEDTGDGHTLISGHIGTSAPITNIIIAVGGLVGFVMIFSARLSEGTTLALSVGLVVIITFVLMDRLRAFDSWLRWLLKGVELPQDAKL